MSGVGGAGGGATVVQALSVRAVKMRVVRVSFIEGYFSTGGIDLGRGNNQCILYLFPLRYRIFYLALSRVGTIMMLTDQFENSGALL